MIGKVYPLWIRDTVTGTFGYAGSTFTAVLLNSSYTFSATHQYLSNVTSYEVSIVGYSRKVPSGLNITYSSNVTKITFDPITFSGLTATVPNAPKYMVLARVGAADSSSALILLQDFETVTALNNEDLVLTPSASGFLRYTTS